MSTLLRLRRLVCCTFVGLPLLVACGGETTMPQSGASLLENEGAHDEQGHAPPFLPPVGAGGGGDSDDPPAGSAGSAGTAGVAGAAGSTQAAVPGDEGGTTTPGKETCWCTRRPAGPVDPICSVGKGVSVAQTVGPEGGWITAPLSMLSGVGVQLQIPPGALVEDTLITITETSEPPPAGFVDWSPVYRFEPTDLVFLEPVFVKIPWESGNVGPESPPHPIAVQWSTDDVTFTELADSYINAGFHTATTMRLGYAFSGFPKGETFAHCP